MEKLWNYLKLGFRNAIRNGLTSSINLIGLSVALGITITIFTFIDSQFHMDSFHKNRSRIYQITNIVKEETGDLNESNWGDSPYLLGPMLQQDNPAIEAFTRIEYGTASLRYNELVFNESVWFVDQAFMSILNFDVLYGNPLALKNKNEIILTQPMAEKYFGNRNPVGEVISIKFSNEVKEEFVIGAVLATAPGNSSLRFDNLISLEAFESLKLAEYDNWNYFTDATLIMCKEGHSVVDVAATMEKYRRIQNAANVNWPIQDFRFYPFETLSRKIDEIANEVASGSHPAGMFTLGTISVMLLLLACFNYMNVAVATVSTRLKEIGIRKVVGGAKGEIVMQFLTENLVLCTLSVLMGILFAYLFFMPGLNSLFPITVSFANASAVDLITFLVCILLVVALVSGAYPAIYVSSFQPVKILSGKQIFGAKSLFSKSLLTVQFMLAFITIIGSFVFIENSLNLRDKDWGYEHDQNIVVPVINSSNYEGMRGKVSTHANIISYAGAKNHIGGYTPFENITYANEKTEVAVYKVGFNYLETMNMRLKEGRFFNESIQSDKEESVIVNSTFCKKMKWEDPIGQSFEYDSIKRHVVGVVEDFHYFDFYSRIEPVIFVVTPEADFKYIVSKAEAGFVVEVEQFLKKTWSSVAPDDPYVGYFQDKVFEDFYNDTNSNIKLLEFVAAVTVLLACMGLFGLVSYSITRRMKELSIRKVFGANISNIFRLMNGDYVWILVIAFVLGAPTGFFLISKLITIIYPDPSPASAYPFVMGVLIMLFIVALTISIQMRRIVNNNPTKTLREE